MSGDLVLKNRQPGDLELRRDRASADLYLQSIATGDLLLKRPPERQGDLHASLPALVSGIEGQVQGPAIAELHGTLPSLQTQLAAEYGAGAKLHAVLPGLVSSLESAYDNAVWRGIESRSQTAFESGIPRHSEQATGNRDALILHNVTRNAWEDGAKLRRELRSSFEPMVQRRSGVHSKTQGGRRVARDSCTSWEGMNPKIRPGVWSFLESASPVVTSTCPKFKELSRKERPELVSPQQGALLLFTRWCGDYQYAKRHRLEYCWGWQEINLPVYGWGGTIVIYSPPPKPVPDPCSEYGEANLMLLQNRELVLVLDPCVPAGEQPGHVIPIRRVYIVAYDAHLVRVSDGLELPVFSLSMSIDVDAWAWQFDAELPADQLANVQPDANGAIEVEATANTYQWRFLVEDIRRTRSFGKSRIHISGRGVAARLADPYSPTVTRENTSALNATQILDDLLTNNGVPIGWAIDWQLTDWLVTAGAWSHSGSYMSGVKAVAEAAGAIVQADRTAQTLHLIHRYPVAPWDWATTAPAYSIPEDVVVTEGVEWIEKPSYNAAYVSGETNGIIGHVVRSGTAGDIVAPMIVNNLVTAQEAARQRGIAVLSDTGKQAIYSLSMPLDPTGTGLGLLEPCQLIEYGPNSARGLVRSTRVAVTLGQIRQTISLETRA